MPSDFGFLKYGKPIAAAAPILLALNLAPGTAYACTGNSNDPNLCINNNGQVIDGFGSFFLENLLVVPGSTTVGEGTVLAEPSQFPGFQVNNSSIQGGNPVSADGFASTPRLISRYRVNEDGSISQVLGPPGDPIFADTIDPSLEQFFPINVLDTVGGISDDDLDLSELGNFETSSDFFLFDDSGALPEGFTLFVQTAFPDGGSPQCSQGSPATCSQEFQPVTDAFEISLDPEFRDSILLFAASDDDLDDPAVFFPGGNADFPTDSPGFYDDDDTDFSDVAGGFGAYFELPNGTYQHFIIVTPTNTGSGNDSGSSSASGNSNAGATTTPPPTSSAPEKDPRQAFLERQAASIQRLRDRIESESDPERKAELQQRLDRIEQFVGDIGSTAMRSALQQQDNQGAPVPGRGG